MLRVKTEKYERHCIIELGRNWMRRARDALCKKYDGCLNGEQEKTADNPTARKW